ncbi:MAG: V-type ATP synthase subunit F [Methanopyri archaeon]|jgi:vacuolar-type H+-ATPase subunit F/Vma7|nr:V-type ATP synthase subunit F [Methanopyri archaeon]
MPSYEIAVIGDRDTVIGFRFAGVTRAYEADTVEEAEQHLFKLRRDEGVALILITEFFAPKLIKTIQAITEEQFLPVVLPLPDKHGSQGTAMDEVRVLIKRAVGVDILAKDEEGG